MNRGRRPHDGARDQRIMANRRMRKVERDVAERIGRCLFVIDESGEYCGEPVTNNCHIVSETAVLMD